MDTQQVKHPLVGKEVTYIKDWAEWKKHWERESCAEVLHSLLHFGFGVFADSNEIIERLCLYLEIADSGDRHSNIFSSNKDDERPCVHSALFPGKSSSKEDLRKALSQKAFQMLCQNFFKDVDSSSYRPFSWLSEVISPQALAKLFWFFRLDHSGDILNISTFIRDDEHHKQIARNFVHELCLFIWDCGDDAYPHYNSFGITENVREIFRQARSEVITLLFGLGELDRLLKGNRYKSINEDCLNKIKSLALDYKVSLPDSNIYRKPLTIEEACLGGSQAAQVLILLRIILGEKGCFDEMRRLDEEIKLAEEHRARLVKKLQ